MKAVAFPVASVGALAGRSRLMAVVSAATCPASRGARRLPGAGSGRAGVDLAHARLQGERARDAGGQVDESLHRASFRARATCVSPPAVRTQEKGAADAKETRSIGAKQPESKN